MSAPHGTDSSEEAGHTSRSQTVPPAPPCGLGAWAAATARGDCGSPAPGGAGPRRGVQDARSAHRGPRPSAPCAQVAADASSARAAPSPPRTARKSPSVLRDPSACHSEHRLPGPGPQFRPRCPRGRSSAALRQARGWGALPWRPGARSRTRRAEPAGRRRRRARRAEEAPGVPSLPPEEAGAAEARERGAGARAQGAGHGAGRRGIFRGRQRPRLLRLRAAPHASRGRGEKGDPTFPGVRVRGESQGGCSRPPGTAPRSPGTDSPRRNGIHGMSQGTEPVGCHPRGLLVISGGCCQGAALFSSLQGPWGGVSSRSPARPGC